MLPGVGPKVADRLANGGCALVVAPPEPAAVDRVCRATLAGVPGRANLLGVLADGEPEAVLADWLAADGADPAQAAVVAVGDTVSAPRSVAGVGPVPVDVVAAPGDLAAIGRSVTARLGRWAATERPLVLCVDAVGPLLAAVAPETAFRFLAILTRQVADEPGGAVVGLDPAAVDATVRLTVETLFDLVLERDGGAWTTREP